MVTWTGFADSSYLSLTLQIFPRSASLPVPQTVLPAWRLPPAVSADAHIHGPRLGFFVADDQHERNLLHGKVANSGVHLFRPIVHERAYRCLQLLVTFLRIQSAAR